MQRIKKCQSALEEQVRVGEVDLETGVRVLADEEKSIFHTKEKSLNLTVSRNLAYSRRYMKTVVER